MAEQSAGKQSVGKRRVGKRNERPRRAPSAVACRAGAVLGAVAETLGALCASVRSAIRDCAARRRRAWHEARLRGFRRAARGAQSGVTLVELLVAMSIFSIFTAMFATTVVQFMHTSQRSMMRTQSATQINNATEDLAHFVMYAEGMTVVDDGDSQQLYLLIPSNVVSAASAGTGGTSAATNLCVRVTYTAPVWSGDALSSAGTLSWTSAPFVAGASGTTYATSDMVFANRLLNSPSAPSPYDAKMFEQSGSMLTVSPSAGAMVSGKVIATSTSTTLTVRNYTSTGDVASCVTTV